MENYFAKLNQITVSEHVEKKGGFSYLSWPYAVQKLRQADPTATWQVMRFAGLPYQKTEAGYFVEVIVTVQGVALSQIHPVLDIRNKPIESPNAFEINTSIQRCLVKAIALHGLGLSVYGGEDLPDQAATAKSSVSDHHPTATPASPAQIRFIERLIDETGSDLSKLLTDFNVTTLSNLTTQGASQAIAFLQKRRKVA